MQRKQNGIQMPQNPLTEVKEDTSRNAEPPTAKKIVQSITLLGERFASEMIVSSELSAIVVFFLYCRTSASPAEVRG